MASRDGKPTGLKPPSKIGRPSGIAKPSSSTKTSSVASSRAHSKNVNAMVYLWANQSFRNVGVGVRSTCITL